MRLSLLQKLDNAHEDSVWAASWAPGSNRLVTGSVDETVKVWNDEGETLKEHHTFVSPTNELLAALIFGFSTFKRSN